ncbi:hypothetical protein BOX15_Mlig017158g2 [Macrostomum lignano]|uniref:PDZ GRASP-type domain-containing protein n=1 Tax=Macrostomum lignano TaxID=282301 RepID=A0A267FT98_9PLAT|nr:hypothetical protein BOX15_Mlig017158g2 [Macrostomum lignano]
MGQVFSNKGDYFDRNKSYAFHILRVQHNSPAKQAGLQPYFDFILAINGQHVTPERQLHSLLRPTAQALSSVDLTVYSSKQRTVRQVHIDLASGSEPGSGQWGGHGLLGVSVRLCCSAGQPALAWRVLDVAPGSPASVAGLRPDSDFIVGGAAVVDCDAADCRTGSAPLHTHEDLFELIESHAAAQSALQLHVYCSSTEQFRLLTVRPDPNWGGDGALGCGLGYGYLHQIPDGGAASECS